MNVLLTGAFGNVGPGLSRTRSNPSNTIHVTREMFDVPLDNRMEYAHTRDVGLAMANAVSSEEVWGKILLIGGGARCQYRCGSRQLKLAKV